MRKTIFFIFIPFGILLTNSCKNQDNQNELIVSETILYKQQNFDYTDDELQSDPALQSQYKVSYPQITDEISSEVLEKINKQIYAFIQDTSTSAAKKPDIKKQAEKLFREHKNVYEDRDFAPGWLVDKSIDIESKLGPLITLSFTESSYLGGAHPNTYTLYKTFDINSGKEVKLFDIIDSAKVSDLNKLRLEAFVNDKNKSLPEGDWKSYVFNEEFEEEGAFNANTNFKITKEGIEFYYNSYEIAAYAFGPSKVKLSSEEIKPLLLNKSPYYRFITKTD